MIQKIKTQLTIALSLAVLAVPAFATAATGVTPAAGAGGGTVTPAAGAPATPPPAPVCGNDISDQLTAGANSTATGTTTDCTKGGTASTDKGVADTAKTVVNILSLIVGAVSVIMIIIGGFKYVVSGGSSDKVTSAKNTIIYALVGLVIVALAQVIVHFVINKAASI